MDDLIQEFINEVSESLAELDSKLVRLEKDPNDPDLVNDIFRVMHTIKGTCGFIGLSRLEKVAHTTETLLDKFRNGCTVTSDAVTVILAAIDTIKEITTGIAQNEGVEPAGDDLILLDLINDIADQVTSKTVTSDSDATEIMLREMNNSGHNNNVSSSETKTSVKSEEKKAKEESPKTLSAAATVATGQKHQTTENETAHESKNQKSTSSQSVRVSVNLLDDLMNLVGELVLARNQIQQIARHINVSDLSVPVQNLSHVASELQESVMKTRMQPIGSAWQPYPRIIRDLAKELGKKIELERVGEDTEMDRQILELIKDPLTHMVRNCADHALETPAERLAAGKPETGTITLKAFHEGGHIIIKIMDDGRGIPVAKVAEKALERGIVTKEQIDSMSPSQIRSLIFRPGFSTAETITSVSGRGVGMDVVRTNVEKIGGTISLESEEGVGTTFSIKIPLTLAIVAAFIVQSGDQKFAIPQINVIEIVNVTYGTSHTIERVNGIPMLRLRERLFPMVSLGSVLDLKAKSENTVLVCQVGSDIFGILVDGVLDTEEIVVKPLSKAMQDVPLYSGNTILGDGSVIMILDPTGLSGTVGIISKNDGPQSADIMDNPWEVADVVQMLVFSTGEGMRKAVHLGIVARLEQIDTVNIRSVGENRYLAKYRDKLMTVVCPEGWAPNWSAPYQSVIVFTDGDRSMGLAVKDIVEIIETQVSIDISSSTPGIIGNAIIAGEPTEIIDVSHYLQVAFGDWFKATNERTRLPEQEFTVLLVDDSRFFRNMLAPMIQSRGYNVQQAENPVEALSIMEHSEIDVLVSDIEMPLMDGIEFIKTLREDTRWKHLPAIAVSSHATPEDMEKGKAAGFDDYIKKMDRDDLFKFLSKVTVENKKSKKRQGAFK